MIGAAMRIVKVGVLAPTNKGIPLGVQGENRATQVEFDTRPWFREYPYGTVSAVARRDGDPAPYPLALDVADGTAVWQVSDTDTAKAGEGAVELTMTSAGARVRSLTFKTLVTASLTDSPVDDDAWYGWLDKAVVKVDETVQSAQRKMAEVDEEWTGLKADVTAKVDECGKVAAQAAQDAHHAKVDAQATAKALESAEGSVAKAEAAASRAVNASIAADDSAAEASRSALSAGESADAAAGSAANAATSASEAATSAGNAADSASAASGSASAAAQSAADASNSKAAAQTAKAEAETAKGEAATSASNAAESATAAAKSASDAAASVGAINVIAPKTIDIAPTFVGGDSIAIGRGAKASDRGNFSIVIGSSAHSHSIGTVAIGSGACDTIDTAGQNVIIGDNAQVNGAVAGSVVLGSYSIAVKDAEVAIGHGSTDTGIAETTREITHVSEPTADTSAATKSYVDTNTSNALVRTVTDTIVTVDDAWTQEPLMLSFKGVAIQNGTPSVDKPVDVKMITSPSVTIAGRNLIIDCKVVDTPEPFTPVLKCKCGIKSSEHFVLSFDSTAVGRGTYANEHLFNYNHLSVESSNELPVTTVDVVYSFAQIDSGGYFIMLKTDSKSDIGFNATNVQFERGDVATAYEPYSGQSVAIALPEEHPYLASLPDGTADEVIIDAYGNVTLVASVTMYKATGDEVLFYDAVNDEFYIVGTPIVSGSGYSPEFPYVPTTRGTFGFATSDQGAIYMSNPGVITDYDSAVAWVKAHTPTFYGHAASVSRYSLGKVTLPQLKAGVSNVWIDGGMCGAVTMTYKRDINIAFDNLVQAVVAAAAGE